ncbi:hypothetical protein F5Y17DRAFT_293423 [Xylariaceae sp. FL0594]|nr:hypothetical protein F5Y17DRAFT_293423 [Xylariaceae sp. FL0594]
MMAEPDGPLDVAVRRLMRRTQVASAGGGTGTSEELERAHFRQLDISNTSGDTLVTVRFPPGQYFDCDGFQWETKEFLVNSEQLLATGSAVFSHLLSRGARALARRQLDRHARSLPESVKFAIDLSPQTEGEDSAFLVTQMSLSQNVSDWWRYGPLMAKPASRRVSGHDDHCPNHFNTDTSDHDLVQHKTPWSNDSDLRTIDDVPYPNFRVIADYCPIRHRVAILRLLEAITSKRLLLNSAPRVVTMTAMAKALDCTNIVKDPVMMWLMADPGLDFVGVNPEDALKISWTLQLGPIARTAFIILVVEKAFETVGSSSGRDADKPKNRLAKRTLFGRARAPVTEEQDTCIQHAAQVLLQRTEDLWLRLNGPDVHQLLAITEWPAEYPDFCDGLTNCIHVAVARATEAGNGYVYLSHEIDEDRARYVPEADRPPTMEIYRGLLPQQALLTPIFWDNLAKITNNHHGFFDPIYESHLGEQDRYRVLDDYGSSSVIEFGVDRFFSQLANAFRKLYLTWRDAQPEIPYILRRGPLIFGRSEELVKFLPLWAGGLDDGTGGVYQSDIPDAVSGAPYRCWCRCRR